MVGDFKMNKAKPTDLMTRWTKAVVRELNPKLFGTSLGPSLHSAKVGRIVLEGREYLDLQGYPFDKMFINTSLDRIDFSRSLFHGPAGFYKVTANNCRFIRSSNSGPITGKFTDCCFDGCVFKDPIGWIGNRFIRCSFEGAKFRSGGVRGSRFEHCSFRKCKITRTEFVECHFDACDFTDAVFKNALIGHSSITRVRNNFRYHNNEDWSEQISFVANPDFQTIYFGETSVGATTFSVGR